ncbi:MAG: hypothetical protein RXR52_29550, partial [Paraburkholderia sp.]
MSTPRFFVPEAACATVSSLRAPLTALAVACLLAACGGSGLTVPPVASTTGSGSSGGTTTTTG